MLAQASYGASPIKRERRTKAEIVTIKQAIYDLLRADNPMTLRQLFYRLVTAGVIEKTEAEYKTTAGRLLIEMRLDGDVPFDWVADSTRWMRKPTTYDSLQDALASTARYYRRAIWRDLPAYVEVWCEKDALAGVLYEETATYDVPLMVSKGYASLTYLHEAAQAIIAQQKPTFLYQFGDHDPAGVDIPRNIEARLRQFAPDAEIHFERVAVQSEQIAAWGLPTRPTKSQDTRARKFEGDSVEVDAIPPTQLRQLVRDCIGRHVDPVELKMLEAAESSERGILRRLSGRRYALADGGAR